MHILDLIMYIVLAIILWFTLNDEYTHELGTFIGICIMFIYTIIYMILFVWIDYNWSDINIGYFKFDIKW